MNKHKDHFAAQLGAVYVIRLLDAVSPFIIPVSANVVITIVIVIVIVINVVIT